MILLENWLKKKNIQLGDRVNILGLNSEYRILIRKSRWYCQFLLQGNSEVWC